MTDEPLHPLSPTGRARREAMLADLTETLRQTHRARRFRRRTLVAAVLTMSALAAIRLSLIDLPYPDRVPVIADTVTTPPRAPQSAAAARCVVVRVETDPVILDRLRARTSSRVALLDDPALIATLAQLRRPAGLIRDTGEVRLSAPVTDVELAMKPRG